MSDISRILEKPPEDPSTSWREDRTDLDNHVSLALIKLLETRRPKSDNVSQDPLDDIHQNTDELHHKLIFAELKGQIPKMVDREAVGVPVKQAFHRVYNAIGRDHDRVTRLTKKAALLSNQLFDLEQGKDNDLEWKLQDFTERHEPDMLEIQKVMKEMQVRMNGLSQSQLEYAREVAHHAEDTGLALADLNVTLDKSRNMNVKERGAMYFVTGKLAELKKDLKKNLSADNSLRNDVEKMKTRLQHVIEVNKKRLEKKREKRRKRKEAKLLKSMKDVNPQLNELSSKLEKLKQHRRNIEDRAKRQEEMMKQRKQYLEEVEAHLNRSKDYSAALHVKSQELVNQIREGLAYSDADSDSMGSLSPSRSHSRMSINDTVNRINEVARAKSFAARIKAKSNALKNKSNEETLAEDEEQLEEDVNELLSLKLSSDHPLELHQLLQQLSETSQEHSKTKTEMNQLKQEVEVKQRSFKEAMIENDVLEKQIETEKQVTEKKIVSHAAERKELEEMKTQQQEHKRKLLEEKELKKDGEQDEEEDRSEDSEQDDSNEDTDEDEDSDGDDEVEEDEEEEREEREEKDEKDEQQQTKPRSKEVKSIKQDSLNLEGPKSLPREPSLNRPALAQPMVSEKPQTKTVQAGANENSPKIDSLLMKKNVARKIKKLVKDGSGKEHMEEMIVEEEVVEMHAGNRREEEVLPIRLLGRRASVDEAKVHVKPNTNMVRMTVEDMERLMEGLEYAEQDARFDRMRMERLTQYAETLRESLSDIEESGRAFDDAAAVLEQAMDQVEALKLDRETFEAATNRIDAIESIENSRNIPGRLQWEELRFRLPGVEQAMSDLRVKGVLEQQIEALAVTKADKQAFTGQIAAMSGSLRAMVNELRHSDHEDMKNQLKDIAFRLDESSETFDQFSGKVQQETDKMTSTIVKVAKLSSAAEVLEKLRQETIEALEKAIASYAKRIGSQGVELKKLRQQLAKQLHEGALQQYLVDCMDENLQVKDKQVARLTSLVEQLREENSKQLNREELLNLISSRVSQLLHLGLDAGHVNRREDPEEVLRTALTENLGNGMRGHRRKKLPQQSTLLKNKPRF